MNKLTIWGALLLSAAFTPALSQELQKPEIPAHTDYAVNTVTTTDQHPESTNGNQERDDAVRVRTLSKTFPADRSDKVMLSNQYGSMLIKVWDRREVKVDVTVKAYSNNEKEAQSLIEEVSIDANKSGDMISCKTNIENGSRWYKMNNKRREVRVDYVVYLPAANALSLSQQYGSVNIADFSGPINAKVQYGDFIAGNLANENNMISVQYGKTNIQELNKASIKQQYGSGLTIGTAGTLDLNAQYAGVNITTIRGDATIRQQYGSGLKVGSVNNLDLDAQYANVNISMVKGNATIRQQYNALMLGSVGRLMLRSQYTGVNIGTLRGDANFKMSYNNFTVADITSGCKRLVIDADYVDLSLNFGDSFNGDFNLQKSYGSFKYDNNVRVSNSNENEDRNSTTKRYTGKIGNGGGSTVQIETAYGSVTFK